jgi:polygalacturonase
MIFRRRSNLVGLLAFVTVAACGTNDPSIILTTTSSTSTTSSSRSSSSGPGSTSRASSSVTSSAPIADSGAPADAAGDVRTGPASGCGAGDANMPDEPTIPPACTTLQATQAVAQDAVADETTLDTVTLQTALNACGAGHSLRLAPSASNNAFITGPLTLPTGVTLWVDAGVTLYGTRDPAVYGAATALISARSANAGIVGEGVIDGQGGEPQIGSTQTPWDVNGGGGSSPALIQTVGATNFTLYEITLHNAPMFHVKLNAQGFVVWGITIKTPSKTMNSAGTALTPSSAHNTDGVDPGEQATNGYIVCSSIYDGDDHIAIKGGTMVNNLLIAHNHFGAGHGMSIGSETNGGVSNVNVYDLSIDGTGTGLSGGSSNGIRIKSDLSVGGPVTNITYSDVCVRGLTNPIILTPKYSSATGTSIPDYTGITIRDFHALSAGKVTILGYDATHPTQITLDNVVVDGIAASNVTASYANVTLGPGAVNFTPSGTGVTTTSAAAGTSQPNPCTDKWVTF